MGRKNGQEERLLSLLNSSDNRNACGECKAHHPTWASWNLGVFLCGRCASAHRSLGTDISQVKSLSMETWSSLELSTIARIGNRKNNAFWNEKDVQFPFDPEDKDVLVTWLRNKYTGRFMYGAVSDEDYNLKHNSRDDYDSTDDYGFDKGKRNNSYGRGGYDDNSSGVTRSMRKAQERLSNNNRLYHNNRRNDSYDDYESRSPSVRHSDYSRESNSNSSRSTLSFRKPTESEIRRYGNQSRKMKFDMGYEDQDVNIEALSLARGDINKAINIIKSAGRGPAVYQSDEKTSLPALPKRRNTAGALFDSSKAGGFDWLVDGSNSTGNQSVGGSNSLIDLDSNDQIYQYVDPNTGSVYYIDSNGQQYADPNATQQQMMTPMQLQQAQNQLAQSNMSTQPQVASQQQQMYQQQLQQQQLQQQQMYHQQLQQQQMYQPQFQQNTMGVQSTGVVGREPTLAELQQQQQLQQMQQQTGVYGGYPPQQFQGF